jgi:hypothetical protein
MNTKTMVKKFEEKGWTMEDLQGNWKAHETGGTTYKDWVSMMKQVVEKFPTKQEMEGTIPSN